MVPPITHTFTIDGEPYTLKQYTHGGDNRWRLDWAKALAQVPGGVLDGVNGTNLMVEAVARECLTQAPATLWNGGTVERDGKTVPVPVFGHLSIEHWAQFRREVNVFLDKVFHREQRAAEPALPDSEAAAPVVASHADLPAPFTGRAS